jgi:hypothetical protein
VILGVVHLRHNPLHVTTKLTSALLRKVLRFGRNNTSLKSNLISLIIFGIINQNKAKTPLTDSNPRPEYGNLIIVTSKTTAITSRVQ